MLSNSIFYNTFFNNQKGGDKKEKEKKERKKYINKITKNLLELRDDSKAIGKEGGVVVDMRKISIMKLTKILSKTFKTAEEYKQNGIVARVGNTYITLNQTNLSRMKSLYNVVEDDTKGSDADFVRKMKNNKVYIERKEKPEHKGGIVYDIYQGKEGAYWKYYNKTEFDLSRYGVFRKNEGDYEENCLFNALKNGGLDEVKLNDLRFKIKSRNTPTNKLKKIADELGIYIKLKKLKNKKEEDKEYLTRTIHYGDKTKEEYNIGLIDEHFFIIEKTIITSYALLNGKKIKHIKDFRKIYKKYKNKYKKSNKRFINSFELMKLLLINKEKLLEPIPYDHVISSQFYDKDNGYTSLKYNYNSIKLIVDKKKKKKERKKKDWTLIFFDFETYTNENEIHVPYLCCMKKEGELKQTFIGEDCALKMLNKIKDKNVILIAHNCYYDFQFLIKHLENIRNPILKGNSIISCEASFFGVNIKFKDSYKLITMPLRKFGKSFLLDQKKEIMPYDAYNIRNPLENEYMKKEEFLSFVKEEDRKECLNNCIKWNCYDEDDEEIDIIEYSKRYCEMDVIVLEKGYFSFREMVLDSTGLDINNQFTIAGLSYNYIKKSKCFDGCYEMSGIPRDFIQKCVVGGKCMTNSNKKYKVLNTKIADFDSRSCYPSGMNRMPGFLKGRPKVLKQNQLNYEFLKSVDGYFIKIKILDVGKKRHFPAMSYKNEDGIRIFTNDMKGREIHVDRFSLEDLINFQDISFIVIEGYYYDEGRNPQIKETILHLYNERLKLKDKKSPTQLIYKLILNSAFGRTLLKPIEEDIKILDSKKHNDYLFKKYNHIKESIEIADKFFVKEYKPINSHYNSVHIGVEILSMSKRIMNEVMYLAEDNGIFIYYTDTDSIQLNYDDVAKLRKLFKEDKRYNRELIGRNLGQFHIDFEMDEVKDNKTIYGRNAYYLGKKMYMVELVGKNKEGKEVVDYHIRMKGIPSSCIEYECRKNNISPLEIYDKLYNKKTIDFDLTQDGQKACFEYIKHKEDGMIVKTKSEFSRKVKCTNEEGVIPKVNSGRCTII